MFVAREDFKYFTLESERSGTLPKAARQIIHNVIDFRAVTAREMMIPIDQVISIPAEASVNEALALCHKHQIDRLPITADGGKMTGTINALDLLFERNLRGNVSSYMRRIITVGPEEPCYHLIRRFRAARIGVAAVVQDRAIGIVTYEELLRRLLRTGAN
jgi:CBS domain containing-hemolysin-like protein